MNVERRATAADIDRLTEIRGSVQENRLMDPKSVTRGDYERFVFAGRVWVIDSEGQVAGFSASDTVDGSIWALFVDAKFEGCGLGSRLLGLACDDLRREGHAKASLTTGSNTKAARLYRARGWTEQWMINGEDIRFERSL
jgi:ribosomal protein S18 acetylase RimI-like enzyme